MKPIESMRGLAVIAPLKELNLVEEGDFAMCLTHIALGEDRYCEFYKNYKGFKLLDNSFFELKRALSFREVMKACNRIEADCIVLKDGTLDYIDDAKKEGLYVMAVPTTREEFHEFLTNEKVDKVGVSCLHIPKIMGEEVFSPCRGIFIRQEFKRYANESFKHKIHFLGSTNRVLRDIKDANGLVTSIDSSLPYFAALENASIDTRVDKEFSFWDGRTLKYPKQFDNFARNVQAFKDALKNTEV